MYLIINQNLDFTFFIRIARHLIVFVDLLSYYSQNYADLKNTSTVDTIITKVLIDIVVISDIQRSDHFIHIEKGIR